MDKIKFVFKKDNTGMQSIQHDLRPLRGQMKRRHSPAVCYETLKTLINPAAAEDRSLRRGLWCFISSVMPDYPASGKA